jgi:hypothetical protein
MWRYIVRRVILEVSNDCGAFICSAKQYKSRVKQSKESLLGMFDPEDERTTIFQKVWN